MPAPPVPAGIDVDDPWEAIEACYAQEWTDGLPVVPPIEPLVARMLAAGPWGADDVLLLEPVRGRAVTAYKAAINAVMAGCRPEYFPVVGAALAAAGDPGFELHGPATSTGGAALMVIVNGPIRERLGLNGKANLLGPGARANATIGRALRLVLWNCLECRPGVLDKSTQGWPGKYSLCFAEDEASSPWEPLSVSRGFR
ncbi:MAG: thioredoxin, partial [Candidatus Rokubacteria bacterium]|nr:thioredoxin [Candidatus Rokubacteria bacterium]